MQIYCHNMNIKHIKQSQNESLDDTILVPDLTIILPYLRLLTLFVAIRSLEEPNSSMNSLYIWYKQCKICRCWKIKKNSLSSGEKNLARAFSQLMRKLFYLPTANDFTLFDRLVKTCTPFLMEIVQTEEIVANICWPFKKHCYCTGFQTNSSLPKELGGRSFYCVLISIRLMQS